MTFSSLKLLGLTKPYQDMPQTVNINFANCERVVMSAASANLAGKSGYISQSPLVVYGGE